MLYSMLVTPSINVGHNISQTHRQTDTFIGNVTHKLNIKSQSQNTTKQS